METAVRQNPDIELVAVFTRRPPESIKADTSVVHISQLEAYKGKIDVMILCGGSATDLPEQGPKIAEMFNTVDSFDNHGKIPEYFAMVDKAARKGNNLSLILRRLGSGFVFIDEAVGAGCITGQLWVYFLGQGSEPGSFRCYPQDTRR